jgi:hypothetical protein
MCVCVVKPQEIYIICIILIIFNIYWIVGWAASMWWSGRCSSTTHTLRWR